MAYLLHIESATTNCSVALTKNGNLLATKELNAAQYSHAENLHAFINEVVSESELNINQLDGISISKGPGSYTGLRIGVSAAKGLAFGLHIPLISVGTLEALAHQIKIEKGLIIPMLDARRMEAYTQVFTANYEAITSVDATLLNEDTFVKELQAEEVHFLGSGASKFAEICHHTNAHFYPDLYPSAKEQAKIAYQKFNNKDFEDTAYFEPFYLKDFVAGKPKKQF